MNQKNIMSESIYKTNSIETKLLKLRQRENELLAELGYLQESNNKQNNQVDDIKAQRIQLKRNMGEISKQYKITKMLSN